MQTTTVKQKGNKVIRVEGDKFITSELIWIGGPVGKPRTEEQQGCVDRVVAIRSSIRAHAESRLIESVASRMMENTRQKMYQVKVQRAKELDVNPKYIKSEIAMARRGYQVITLN